jgi:hypothetical protein
MFGWKQICDVHEREEVRKKQGTTGQTRMKYAAAYPDMFTKMSAEFAKIPFTSDVIMEQTLYLVGLIGKQNEFMAVSSIKGGSNCASYKMLLDFLGSELKKESFTNLHSATKLTATASLNTLEFCISVGSIFVETFMKSSKQITRDNVNEIQKQMDESLNFFLVWWQQINCTAGDTKETKNKKFISKITYANLRTGISGFFQEVFFDYFSD